MTCLNLSIPHHFSEESTFGCTNTQKGLASFRQQVPKAPSFETTQLTESHHLPTHSFKTPPVNQHLEAQDGNH